ncbi:uncharacterized protein LOC111684876 [Lucilia cuprina]|nr:uncharacterized protein LOC111684876 [Lucilia cuprina]KAI8117048.1 hypothetical protein CVS40_11002 [Lucilia cuprina]
MLNFKVVFLLMALTAPGMFALSCRDLEDAEANGEIPAVMPDEAQVKINWGPVWDDIEGNNEFVVRNLEVESEEDNQNCEAPNGLGLKNLFVEVEKLLPQQKIKTIVKSYAEDPEVKALKAFIQSPQTQEKLKIIQNSQEYQILKDYSCRILHIDLVKYNKLARTLINPSLNRADYRKGIRGLINEVDAVLPRKELRELYQNLLASDEELAKAVANLKSPKFHQLLLNVKNNVPEYKELTKQLSGLGVPIEEMRERLANALGWAPELGLFV